MSESIRSVATTHQPARLIPAEQAASRLHRHPITLRRDLREGKVPGIKIGGRWFVSSVVLDRITSGEPPDPAA